jgi:hypothetical protein
MMLLQAVDAPNAHRVLKGERQLEEKSRLGDSEYINIYVQ